MATTEEMLAMAKDPQPGDVLTTVDNRPYTVITRSGRAWSRVRYTYVNRSGDHRELRAGGTYERRGGDQ